MGFSLQTVLTAILATNILIILMTIIFKNTNVMIQLGYKLLLLGVALIILRLCVPFEFSFTSNVYLPEFLSFIIAQIRQSRINSFSLWHVLLIVWALGILYKVYLYWQERRQLSRFITENGKLVTDVSRYAQIMNELYSTRKRPHRIELYEISSITSPMTCGILHPKILIPDSFAISESDLRIILQHELSHYYHGDLLIKLVIQIICIIYWWNPLCIKFQAQVNDILEIRIDHELTHADKTQKAEYFSCLLMIAKHSSNNTFFPSQVVHYSLNDESILRRRIEIGLDDSRKRNHVYEIFFITILLLVYLCSHLFILEPFYTAPEDQEETFGTMTSEFYYIIDENGIYNIYFRGKLIETTDSLEYYPGIQPYEEGEN